MKGIPTMYAGYRFRSRLEAKWAAFFDTVGWRWEYEPFDRDGWIPDFALPCQDCGADRSHWNSKPTLVEVKPIAALDPAVIAKIDAADQEHEVLLLGLAPLLNVPSSDPDQPVLGWLRERHDMMEANDPGCWGPAVLGHWYGSVGFCSADGSFHDRVSGGYTGSCGGDVPTCNTAARVREAWAHAANITQWRGR